MLALATVNVSGSLYLPPELPLLQPVAQAMPNWKGSERRVDHRSRRLAEGLRAGVGDRADVGQRDTAAVEREHEVVPGRDEVELGIEEDLELDVGAKLAQRHLAVEVGPPKAATSVAPKK